MVIVLITIDIKIDVELRMIKNLNRKELSIDGIGGT